MSKEQEETQARKLQAWCEDEFPLIRGCGSILRQRITDSLREKGLLKSCKHEKLELVEIAGKSFYTCIECGGRIK